MRDRFIIIAILLVVPLAPWAQPRQRPEVATKTVEYKNHSHSIVLTYAEATWGPKTWESIMHGVDVGGTRRWFFALLKVHGKAQIDGVRLKSGRYALILNPRQSGSPTISIVKTREKKLVSPDNLRGQIPRGKEVGHVSTRFNIREKIVDPMQIDLRSNDDVVVLHFRYGNQEMEKTLRFQ